MSLYYAFILYYINLSSSTLVPMGNIGEEALSLGISNMKMLYLNIKLINDLPTFAD